MLRFEWNALGVGDTVAVHDAGDAQGALLAGTVVMIEPRRSKRGVNGVGIRVEANGAHRVVWPSYLTVHPDPADPSQNCWRCAALVDAALPHLVLSGTPAMPTAP